jgi:hypothetical protein
VSKLPKSLQGLNSDFAKSVFVLMINLFTAFIILLLIYFTWGIESYGRYAAFTTNIYIILQLINFGNSPMMVSQISNAHQEERNRIFANHLKTIFVRSIKASLLCSIVYFFALQHIPTNFRDSLKYIPLIVVSASVNKLFFYLLTLERSLTLYLCFSLLRNLLLVICCAFSIFASGLEMFFLSFALIELILNVLFIARLNVLSQIRLVQTHSQIKRLRIRSNLPFVFTNLYFEVYPKLDFIVAQLILSPKWLGVYALVSTVNETFHALYMQVRIQLTPKFSVKNFASGLQVYKEILPHFFLIWAFIAFLGLGYVTLFARTSESIAEILLVTGLMYFSNLFLMKPFVLGGVYMQMQVASRGARIFAIHFMTSAITFYFISTVFALKAAWIAISVLSLILNLVIKNDIRKQFERNG